MSQVIEKINVFVDELFEELDTGKGSLILATTIFVVFLAVSIIQHSQLLAPGIYFFGVIVPFGFSIKAALSFESKKSKYMSYGLCVFIVLLSVLDTLRRVYW